MVNLITYQLMITQLLTEAPSVGKLTVTELALLSIMAKKILNR